MTVLTGGKKVGVIVGADGMFGAVVISWNS